MFGSKPAFASAGVIGAAVAILAGLAQLIGYTISAEDQAALVDLINNGFVLVTGLVSLIGGIVALWGRIKATKQITGVVSAPPPQITAADLNREQLERIKRMTP